MTKLLIPPVRGRRSAIFSHDKKAVSVLLRQFDLLGVSPVVNPPADRSNVDVCFLDVDTIIEDARAGFPWPARIPIVALIGTETPGRLEWMMRHEPSAVLMKPLGTHGIFTALVVAFNEARRREGEFLRILKLEERIRARRIVVAAIIKLMKQYGIEEPEAFGMLRNAAQQRGTTVESLSADVVGDLFLPVRIATSR